MSRPTWRDILRDDPEDLSPPTVAEGVLMMRAAFLLAADYPQAVRDMDLFKTKEVPHG